MSPMGHFRPHGRLALTVGEAHDNRLAGKLLSRLKSGTMVLADRGYDATGSGPLSPSGVPGPTSRREAIATSRSASAPNSTVRATCSNAFFKIKQRRRVATRCDKLAANYLAFVQLASIRLWLHVNESTPKRDCHTVSVTAAGVGAATIGRIGPCRDRAPAWCRASAVG